MSNQEEMKVLLAGIETIKKVMENNIKRIEEIQLEEFTKRTGIGKGTKIEYLSNILTVLDFEYWGTKREVFYMIVSKMKKDGESSKSTQRLSVYALKDVKVVPETNPI